MSKHDQEAIANLYMESMSNQPASIEGYKLINDKLLFKVKGRYFVSITQESGDIDIYHSDEQGDIGDFLMEDDLTDEETEFVIDKSMELLPEVD